MVNRVSAKPPPPLLPNLSSFAQIAHTKACYMEIQYTFHNLLLPDHLADIFTLPPISLLTFDADKWTYIANYLTLNPNEEVILCPRQAALLMGFTWSVFLVHKVVHASLIKSSNILRVSSMPFQLPQPLKALSATSAPFTISKTYSLICYIIDDIANIMAGWTDVIAISWYRIIRVILQTAGLPLSTNKSSPFTTI